MFVQSVTSRIYSKGFTFAKTLIKIINNINSIYNENFTIFSMSKNLFNKTKREEKIPKTQKKKEKKILLVLRKRRETTTKISDTKHTLAGTYFQPLASSSDYCQSPISVVHYGNRAMPYYSLPPLATTATAQSGGGGRRKRRRSEKMSTTTTIPNVILR